jgi:uncharacterized protein YndB with AHSA1/START domain
MTHFTDTADHAVFDMRAAREVEERWRGPNGFTLLSCEVDFGSGGASRVRMRSPEGTDHLVEGVDLVIVEPERVVLSGEIQVGDELLSETVGTVTFRRA